MSQRHQVWLVLAITVVLMTILVLVTSTLGQESRMYWHVSIEDMHIMLKPTFVLDEKSLDATDPAFHTHVCVSGRATLVKREADGDWHVRIESLSTPAAFIVAEEMPTLKAKGRRPKKGETVTACGISRWDGTHGFPEVHPVEQWRQ